MKAKRDAARASGLEGVDVLGGIGWVTGSVRCADETELKTTSVSSAVESFDCLADQLLQDFIGIPPPSTSSFHDLGGGAWWLK